jgi:hypothetical protein
MNPRNNAIPDRKIGGRDRKGLATIKAVAMNQKYMPTLKMVSNPRATRARTNNQYLRFRLLVDALSMVSIMRLHTVS